MTTGLLDSFTALNIFRLITTLLLMPLCALAEDVSILSRGEEESSCVDNVCFPKKTTIGENLVTLRNLTKESYFVFDLYIAALYINDEVQGFDKVLGETPRKLVFRYLRDFSSVQLIENADKILASNPEVNLESLSTRLDQINKGFADGVRSGDVYELEYEPNKGSTLIRNGKEFCTVPGSDFAKAYFGIWLSQYPLSKELRDSLLKSRDS